MDKHTFNKKLGAFIKMKRQERKWSQSDLASKLSNNFQNISRIERGEVSPTLYWMRNLSSAFNMELSEFIKELEEFVK